MNIDSISHQRLCHLPLVMDVFRRMKVDQVIDHAIPQDQRSKVSASECVATILSGVYSGAYSLWRLRERLEPYDMPTIMQDPTYSLDDFPEERLAKALDDLYLANLDKLMTAIAVQAIAHYSIDTSILHFDTTSLSFYGAYENESAFPAVDGMPPPRVTFGYSKINRGDLKQLMYGMLVSQDGGIPLMGKALDGNAADSTAAAEFFGKIRNLVTDPRKVCCVADSKGWTAGNLGIIDAAGMRLLSRLPRTKLLFKTAMRKTDPKSGPRVLKLPPKTKNGDPRIYEYTGCDDIDIAEWIETSEDGSEIKRTKEVPVRIVRVFSSELLKTKMRSLERLRERDNQRIAKDIRKFQRTIYVCKKDAEEAASRYRQMDDWPTLELRATAEHVADPTDRRQGRPPKYHNPKLAAKPHWRLVFSYVDLDESVIRDRLRDQATFVLIRNKVRNWRISDEDMIRTYKQQYRVEHGFAWLKSDAEINPVFLNTPHRISSLSFIYCIGLMIWNIIQRTVRQGLRDRGTGLPYYRGKPSDQITTRFLFELFPSVSTSTVMMSDGSRQRMLSGFTDVHKLACRSLGTPLKSFHPVGK